MQLSSIILQSNYIINYISLNIFAYTNLYVLKCKKLNNSALKKQNVIVHFI